VKTFRIALSEPNRCPCAHLEASKSYVKWLARAPDISKLQDYVYPSRTRWKIESAPRSADDGAWHRRHASIYAGVIKALDPIRFASDIDSYKILPWAISVRLAFYLPWLEIFCGLGLIARRLYLGGLSILTALASIFILATIAAKIRGLDITCGCFGHASKNWSFSAHLALDLVLLTALLWLVRLAAIRSHRDVY